MTDTQKWIAVLGLCAIAISSFFAPHRFVIRSEICAIDRLVQPESPCQHDDVVYAPIWASGAPSSDVLQTVSNARLDSGEVGLWWAGIAAVTIVSIMLAAPTAHVGPDQ